MSRNGTNGHAIGVDIAIPCYQYGRFLRDCVTSVLTQEFRDVRVLIIDNASTDDSLDVAHQLAAEDRRVEVVAHRCNLGHHASFNEAIDWARSQYFMILCADDLLAPGCLSRAVSFMEEHPHVHLTYGRLLSILAEDPIPQIEPYVQEEKWQIASGREFMEQLCRGARIIGHTMMVRTSVQKRVGYYRPKLPYCDDVEMWLRFACLGAIARTNAVQAIERNHSSNRSASIANIHEWHAHAAAAFESFFTHEGAHISDSKRLRRLAGKSLAEEAYWCAFTALCRRQAGMSRNLLKFAFRICPVPPVTYLFGRMISVALETERWSGPRAARMNG